MNKLKNHWRYLLTGCFAWGAVISGAAAQDFGLSQAPPVAPHKPASTARQPQAADKGRVKQLERTAPSANAAPQNNAASPNEVTKFQGWAVTCFPPPANGGARVCIAKMNILKSNEDRRPILFVNVIKSNGGMTLGLQTPTGVEMKPGVTLQFGQAAARHLDYSSCEPALCTATIQIDDTLANELGSFPTASASWSGLGVGEVRVDFALQEARSVLAFMATR